ncbi:MAG TPA: class I SAM-dependent methyltransferase, partial [Kofleriaceae bacterium]|nr:class I SAM-dependent methyltransferase [Kofleriaceae bacterium]
DAANAEDVHTAEEAAVERRVGLDEQRRTSVIAALHDSGARRVIDLGCGPGLFAAELARGRGLPRDGAYLGLDVSPAAIELARARLAGDPRFAFRVGEASAIGRRADPDVDAVIACFVLSYLDTREVERVIARLARRQPRAKLIVAFTIRSCVDRRGADEPADEAADEAAELRAARRYLAGDPAPAEAMWDLRRLRAYRASIERRYRVVEQIVLRPLAQVVWVCELRHSRS